MNLISKNKEGLCKEGLKHTHASTSMDTKDACGGSLVHSFMSLSTKVLGSHMVRWRM